MREVHRRVAFAGVLLAVLLSMTVHYGAVDARHDRTAIGIQQLSEYDEHVGETVFFWGRVVGSEEGVLVVRASSQTLSIRTDRAPPPGSAVQIYGRLEPDSVVTPERVIVSKASNLRYLYAVSAVGGFLAAVVFLRTWRFDPERLAFVPREGDGA